MQATRRDIDCRSTEEDELPGKYILITSVMARQLKLIKPSLSIIQISNNVCIFIAMKNDSKKAFCQTVRFTMRLRKQMKKFKERKTKMQTLQDETHK